MLESITILGSTGSIGQQALAVIAQHPEQYRVEALTALRDHARLFSQCQQFRPRYAVLVDPVAAQTLQVQLRAVNSATEVWAGQDAIEQVAADGGSTTVLAGIVGSAGLLPTLAAVCQGKRVLLANKESLVMAGDLFGAAVAQHDATLLPVDSEHNAIFQCMPAGFIPMRNAYSGVESIILTASGGPFRTTPLSQFSTITPEQAVSHPNWAMGKKISVDSATMMNKGLEVIEAHYLFNQPLASIEVLLHPQSIVHSMVRYADGSVLAQMGCHDMRTPIAHTLAWPDRIRSGVSPVNFLEVGRLDFEAVCAERFSCLFLAYQALRQGGTAMAILNAANEVAVDGFLQKKIRFSQIAETVDFVLNKQVAMPVDTLESVLVADRLARECANRAMNSEW